MPAFTGTLETFSHTLITSIKTSRECVPHDNALLVFMLLFIACGMAVTYKQAGGRANECKQINTLLLYISSVALGRHTDLNHELNGKV